jgi:hypothetical protein
VKARRQWCPVQWPLAAGLLTDFVSAPSRNLSTRL